MSVLPGTVLAVDAIDSPTVLAAPQHADATPAVLQVSGPGTAPTVVYIGPGSTICRAAIL
jgi:hypothetical protein